MAVDYSQIASTDPSTVAAFDPALQNDPTLAYLANPSAQQSVHTPDLSQSTVDFNNLGLSGDTYQPQAATGIGAPVDPLADPTLQTDLGQNAPQQGVVPVQGPTSFKGMHINDVLAAFNPQTAAPQQAPGQSAQSFTGMHINDVLSLFNTNTGTGGLSPQAGPSSPQYGNDPFGRLLQTEQSNLSPELATGVHSFQENILPTAAGIVGQQIFARAVGAGLTGAATGALAGLGVGDEITVPVGFLVGFGGSLLAGFLAQGATQKIQDAIGGAVVPQQDLQAYEAQRQKEAQQYPLENLGGQAAAQAVFLRPSFSNLSQATRTAARIMTTRSLSGLDPTGVHALLNVALGAATQGGLEAWNQYQQGNFQPVMLAASLIMGSTLSEPTALGRRLGLPPTEMDQLKVGQRIASSEAVDEMQKSAPPDPTGQLGELLRQARTLVDTGGDPSTLIARAQDRITEITQANPEGTQAAQVTPEAAASSPESPVQPEQTAAEAVLAQRPKLAQGIQGAEARGPLGTGDRVRSSGGNTGIIIGKGSSSSARFSGANLVKVQWDNGVTTTINAKNLVPLEPTREQGLISALKEQGGFTSHPVTGEVPKTGFQVGLKGFTEIHPDSISDDEAATALVRYIDSHRDQWSNPANHVGGWHDTKHGEYVFDVSRNVADRNEAVRLGVSNDQQSIWDNARGEEVPTGGTGQRNETTAEAGQTTGLSPTTNQLGSTIAGAETGLGSPTGTPNEGRNITQGVLQNGIQAQTAGQGQGASPTGQTSQTQRPSEAGNAGQIQGQAKRLSQAENGQPFGQTDLTQRPNDGTNATTNAAANAATTNPVTGGSVEPQPSPTTTGVQPNAGIAGRRYASDVVSQLHPDMQAQINSAADRLGLDLRILEIPGDAPVVRPVVLTPEELAAKPGDPNYVADQATKVPTEDGVDFLGGPVTDLAKALQERGSTLGPPPVKLNSDAERLLVALAGWDGRFFYENSNRALSSLRYNNPTQEAMLKALIGVYGQGQGVYTNALDALKGLSRVYSGVYGPDLQDYQDLMDKGILKKTVAKISLQNLKDAVFKQNVSTVKIGPYLRAILDPNSTEFPIDEWMKRLYSGKNGVPREIKGVADGRAYEEGRIRYMAKMLGLTNPKQAQSALWVGYKRLVTSYVRNLIAEAANHPELDSLAKKAASGLSSMSMGDDFETIFREKFGLVPNSEPPMLPVHQIVAKHKEGLLALSRQIQTRWGSNDKPFLTFGPSLDATFQNLKELDNGRTATFGGVYKSGFLRDMSSLWERFYLNKDADQLHSLNILNQDLGRAAEEIASRAYNILHPEDRQFQILSQLNIARDQLQGLSRAIDKGPRDLSAYPNPEDLKPDTQAAIANIDPYGVMELHYRDDPASTQEYGGGYFDGVNDPAKAWITADPQNVLNVVAKRSLPKVSHAVEIARKDKTINSKSLDSLLNNLKLAATDPYEFVRRKTIATWGHEVIHGMQMRMLGWIDAGGTWIPKTARDQAAGLINGPNPLPQAYWELAARRGLGYHVDNILQHITGLTLDQYLRIAKAEAQGKTASFTPAEVLEIMENRDRPEIGLVDSVYAIVEDIDQLTANHMGLPFSEFSSIPGQDGAEVLSRDFYEPNTRKQAEEVIGNWYRDSLTRPQIASQLTAEAEARRIARGESSPSNPLRNAASRPNTSVRPTDRTTPRVANTSGTAGAAAPGPGFERPTVPATTTQSGNPASPDQNRLIIKSGERYLTLKGIADNIQERLSRGLSTDIEGDRAHLELLNGKLADLRDYMSGLRTGTFGAESEVPKAARRMPTIMKGTADVMNMPRLVNEGDEAYLTRVTKLAGIASGQNWKSVDHVRQIMRMADPAGIAKVEVRGGRVGTLIEDKWYPGSPKQIVDSMDPRFRELFNRVDAQAGQTKLQDPPAVSPTKLDPEQLHLSLTAEPRSTARIGAVRALDKFGNPLQIPIISADHFVNTRETVPSEQVSPETATNQITAFDEVLNNSLDVQRSLQHEIDPQLVSQEARAMAAKKTQPAKVTDQSGANYNVEPKDLSSLGESPQDRRALIEANEAAQSRAIVSNYITSFKEARRTATETGSPTLESLANNVNDLTATLFNSWDLAGWMKDSRTWFQSVMGKVNAMQMLYSKIGEDISKSVSDMEGVMNAIDVPNEDVRQQRLAGLNDTDKAIADLLHHYWQIMGDVGRRTGILQSFLEHFLPHITEAPKGGKPAYGPGKGLQTRTPSSISRTKDEFGEFRWPTINELQAHLDEIGNGGTVVRDVGKIFSAHGQGITNAMLMRQFVNRAWGDFEVDFQVPGVGTVAARPMGTRSYLSTLPDELRSQYRPIAMGPMKRVATYEFRSFDRNNIYHHSEPLYVWKPLAENMERLAPMDEMVNNPLAAAATRVRTMNGWFKQYKFKSPTHALSMMSDMAAMTSKGGLFGLPPILNRTVYKTIGRGKEIVTNDRQTYYRALSAGIPAWKDRVPEDLGSVDKVLEGLPLGVGKFFKWFDDMMWRQIGYHGTIGVWDHLVNEALLEKGIDRTDPASEGAVQSIEREMAYHARLATGYLTQLDMTKNWDLLGNTLFLANKWTTGQVRSLGTAFNIGPLKSIASPLANLGTGGGRVIEGATPEITDYLQKKNIALAQRLVIGGTMKLLMTSMFMSTAISTILTGTPTTPVQNFLKDPLHTFDIYAGRDPQTNRDRWIRMPFYLFQRELADYALAGVKAHIEGQDQFSTMTAPFANFANKANPISKLGIELVIDNEIGKWMLGYGNDSIDQDKYITNLHQSLNMMGVPDAGSVENRLLYAFTQLAPTPGLAFPTNLQAPTKDGSAVANALGIGEFNLFNPSNWGTIALGAMGTREQQGTEFVKTPTGEQPIWQVIANANAKKAIGDQIITTVKALSTDPVVQQKQWASIEALRQQAGLTHGQLVQIIEYGVSTTGSNKGALYPPLDPNAAPQAKGTKVLNGKALTPQQNVIYEQVASQHDEFALAQLLNDPNWNVWDFNKRQSEANAAIAFADKITNEQLSLAYGIKSGPQISNIQANTMLNQWGTLKKLSTADLLRSAAFNAASPQDQQVMMADRAAVAQNAVWDKYVGSKNTSYIPKYANLTENQLLQAIDLTAGLRDTVRVTLNQLPSWVNAPDPSSQTNQLNAALTFADTLASESIAGKEPRTFFNPLNQQQLYTAVKNGVILQDETLNELYQTRAYTEADPTTGAKNALENKYIALAHNIALYDLRQGFNTAQGEGYQNAIRTQLAADDAYQQLVDTYGGTQVISKYSTELADLKTIYKQEYSIPPAELARVERYIDTWYYQQHPEYYAFLTQRNNWEKYDPLGQAYKAVNSSDLGYLAASPLANYMPPLTTG